MKTCDSLAARVSTARTLVEECTRNAEDVPAGIEADLWEALEFLTRLDEALDEVPDDAEQPNDDGAGPRNGVEQSPDEAALPQIHSYSDIVVFRPCEGGASQYIAATPNTVKDLAEWR